MSMATPSRTNGLLPTKFIADAIIIWNNPLWYTKARWLADRPVLNLALWLSQHTVLNNCKKEHLHVQCTIIEMSMRQNCSFSSGLIQ